MSLILWIVLGVAAVIVLGVVVLAIWHYPRDNSF
jgi:hypothetical protein